MTHELWTGLNEHIFEFLRSVTLAELVRQQKLKGDVVVLQDHRTAPAAPRTPEAAAL
jgi:Rrf2 family iron-sulfur cluster assembly transcriptional regulator